MNQHGKIEGALFATMVLGLLVLVGGLPRTAQAANVMIASATRLRANDQVLGPMAQSQTIHVVVSLKLQNETKLQAFLATPNHPILTAAQFEQTYSPTAEQAAAVVQFLHQAGFRQIRVAPNRQLVSADAPASTVQTAFRTRMVSVRTYDGRNAYANSTSIEIPKSLQVTVRAVLGLQTVYQAHSFARRISTSAVHTFATPTGGYDPTQFPSIYGASVAPVASGVTVAIMTEGSMTNVLTDLNSFTTNNSLPAVKTQVVDTGAASTDTSGDDEWDMDSQAIVGMAGGQVGTLIFYAAPGMTLGDLTTALNRAVTDNSAKIINVSLGLCETDWGSVIATDDAIFEQAVAQGQTFSVASGDLGADECGTGGTTPAYPATSPYVVAVGGTSLTTTASYAWSGETVWNELASGGGATGGSPSTIEPIPSWQAGIGQNAGSSFRGVPDIAYDGDPATGASVIIDGVATQIAGTSLAAPLFAGAWARVIQAKGTNVGFAAPLIYQMAASSASATFHDVTSGNNNGETAAAGWDYCSGWGSMLIDQALVPTATNGTLSSLENTVANGTLNGSDWDGDSLTFSVVSQPSNGTVTITNAATGAFTYTPNANYHGSDSFTFHAVDPGGSVSNTAVETVTVKASSSGGGGAIGPWALFGLILLVGWSQRRARKA